MMDSKITSHGPSTQLPELPRELVHQIVCALSDDTRAEQLCSDTRDAILRARPSAIARKLSRFVLNAPLQQATQAQTNAALARFVRASRRSNSLILQASHPRSYEHFDKRARHAYVKPLLARLRDNFDALCKDHDIRAARIARRSSSSLVEWQNSILFPLASDNSQNRFALAPLYPLRRDELDRAFAITQSSMRPAFAKIHQSSISREFVTLYPLVAQGLETQLERKVLHEGTDKLLSALGSTPFCVKHLEVDIRMTPSLGKDRRSHLHALDRCGGLEELLADRLATFDLSALESLHWRTDTTPVSSQARRKFTFASSAVNVRDLKLENGFNRWVGPVKAMGQLATLHLNVAETDYPNNGRLRQFFRNTTSNLQNLFLELPNCFDDFLDIDHFAQLQELQLKLAHPRTLSLIRLLPDHLEQLTLILPSYGHLPHEQLLALSLQSLSKLTFVLDDRRMEPQTNPALPLSCPDMDPAAGGANRWGRMLFALGQSFHGLEALEEVVIEVPRSYELRVMCRHAFNYCGASFASIPEQIRARGRYFAQHREMPQPSFRWTFRETIGSDNARAHIFSAMDGTQ